MSKLIIRLDLSGAFPVVKIGGAITRELLDEAFTRIPSEDAHARYAAICEGTDQSGTKLPNLPTPYAFRPGRCEMKDVPKEGGKEGETVQVRVYIPGEVDYTVKTEAYAEDFCAKVQHRLAVAGCTLEYRGLVIVPAENFPPDIPRDDLAKLVAQSFMIEAQGHNVPYAVPITDTLLQRLYPPPPKPPEPEKPADPAPAEQ